METRAAAAGGQDRVPNPADRAGQPDLAASARRAGGRLGSRDPVGARLEEDRHMASTRLIPVALQTAPVVMPALLVGWAMLDVSAIGDGRWSAALFTVLLTGVAAVILSAVLHGRRIRAIGPIAVGAAYVGAHAFVLGVQLMPALVFLSVLISQVELRILAERFSPLYKAALRPDERTRIHGALGRAILRLMVAAVLSVVVPVLAADLAVAGIVPETAIVQIAGTSWRSGWSQVGRYGRRVIIRIQKAGITVAIAHLIRSHVWRFLIEVKRNWSASISACRSVERREGVFNAARSAFSEARRLKILIRPPLELLRQGGIEPFARTGSLPTSAT